MGGVIKFSEIAAVTETEQRLKNGILVDTSVLFAASYPPDFFNDEAEDFFQRFERNRCTRIYECDNPFGVY